MTDLHLTHARPVEARAEGGEEVIVHLIDGTYELFRHFYGQRSFNEGKDKPLGAVAGVLHSVLEMIETGAAHIGVATDHVIESFRNDLWPDYKTGEGMEPALAAQFLPLEEALAAMGVAVWPMIELEADDGLASAAHLAAKDPRVEKVCIWANDKDLAQCVRGDRVVQIIRRGMEIRNAEAVRTKFGVEPALIPDFLALVGDAQDGYPGIRGIGRTTAASLLNRYGPIESFPPATLGAERDRAILFKSLATLRIDAALFDDVDEMEWSAATAAFADWATRIDDKRLLPRAEAASDVRDRRRKTARSDERPVNESAPPG
jgi:5'-3' exonuclease